MKSGYLAVSLVLVVAGTALGGTALAADPADPAADPAASVSASSLSQGPQITLPPGEEGPQPGIPRPPALRLPREQLIEVPLDQVATLGTALGGYGELVLNAPLDGTPVVDLRRLVLFVGHNFTERLRFYGELEIEHAVSSATDKGEIEVEQAFLDYLAWRPLNFRAGVLIMPVSIVNMYHEPPLFHGADRPETDRIIIPSTWREPGIGVFGGWRWLRYQLYVVNGLNAAGFSADQGIRDGHQEASLALAHDWGVVGRLDLVPWLSTDFGFSFYYSNADQDQLREGNQPFTVSVALVEADARLRWRGIEARAQIANLWIGGAQALDRSLQTAATMNNTPFQGPVAQQLLGGYAELSYNIFSELKLRSGMALTPFARYEHTDTQYQVPTGFARRAGNMHDMVTAGLGFRPIAEVALKLDYQHRWTDAGKDAGADAFNAAVAFMF